MRMHFTGTSCESYVDRRFFTSLLYRVTCSHCEKTEKFKNAMNDYSVMKERLEKLEKPGLKV